MKLYLAYRSAYFPNSRFLKEFEGGSILGWFQKNWAVFTENDENEEYVEVLGTDIYGFPIWAIDDEPLPEKPNSLDELKISLEKYIYSNEVIVEENCLRVVTDDDEIELAWFIFTEKYKQENWDKVALWFHSKLPVEFGEIGQKLAVKKEILPKGEQKGCTYFVSCPVYDGGNFMTLEGACKIKNIRLPQLLNHLTTNELDFLDDRDFSFYVFEEIKFLRHISKKIDSTDLEKVLTTCSKIPTTELLHAVQNYEELSIKELINMDFGNDLKKSKVIVSQHFCEVCINSVGTFYNYWIFFDDLWVEKNQELAESILQFGKDWKI